MLLREHVRQTDTFCNRPGGEVDRLQKSQERGKEWIPPQLSEGTNRVNTLI